MLATQPNLSLVFPPAADLGGQANHALVDPSASENRVCPGCKNTVMTEDGGVVVAFGQSFFHVDCFKCAKCNDKVTADTNLLLLSDGSPVCANCSYSCNVCGQPILDEAIMTGDDSYHAHCFNCKVCKKRIDELVFAKTSQGIYCMDCHNERVARSRRHQQRREREKARERAAAHASEVLAAGKAKENTGKQGHEIHPPSHPVMSPPPQAHLQNGTPAGTSRSLGGSITLRSVDQSATGPSNTSLRRGSASSTGERVPRSESPALLGHSVSLPQSSGSHISASLTPSRLALAENPRNSTLGAVPSVNSAPPSATIAPDHSRATTSPPSRSETLDVPDRTSKTLQKRRSYDDRPLNILLKEGTSPQVNCLTIPGSSTSRAEKRRSINPAFAMSFTAPEPANSQHSPTSTTRGSPSPPRSETPPAPNRLPSPLREQFSPPQAMLPLPASVTSAALAYPSPSSVGSDQDQANGRARSASSGAYPEQSSSNVPLRPSITLDRVPARTSSRLDHNARSESSTSGFTPVSPENARRYPDGRLSPVVNGGAGSPLRAQKSFEERPRHGTSSLRNSSSSINLGQTIVVPPRNDNSQPTSPSHKVDVPRGIESGTDTEDETHDPAAPKVRPEDLPPLPPPKESKGAKVGTRPPELKLKTTDIERDNSEMLDSEDLDGSSELSRESSPVEQTSHATFIAPALPPIRFSMGGADFSELLKSVGSPSTVKPPMQILKEVSNEASPLSVNTTLTPPPSSKSVSTPTSDITIIGSETPHRNDVTPVKRRDNVANGDLDQTVRRDPQPQRSHSPSPKPSSHTSSHVYTSSISRASSDLPRPSLDSISEASDAPMPAIDLQSDRDRSFSGSRVGLPPRPSLDGRPSLQRDRSGVRDRSVDSTHRVTAPHMRLTSSEGTSSMNGRLDAGDLVKQRLQEAMSDANTRGVTHVKLNLEFVDAILMLTDQRKEEMNDLKKKIDGMKRASQQYMDGLTVAQTEYDAELKARREAEAEVTRLRVLLSGQAVRLTAISGESRRQEAQRKLSREMSDSLSILERNLSKLKVERDMTIAEVEELSATKSSQSIANEGDATTKLGRALSTRFDSIKSQYAHQLLPLTEQREALLREVEDLKATRDSFLEETTMLNARNEELAQLNAQYVRRIEASGIALSQDRASASDSSHDNKADLTADKIRFLQNLSSSVSSSTVALTDELGDSKFQKGQKLEMPDVPTPQHKISSKFGMGMKWGGSKTPKDHVPMLWPDTNKYKVRAEHSFQQVSVLRPQRCDHCGDKMWGSQLRCSHCNIAVHTRCVHHIHLQCSLSTANGRDEAPPVPTIPASIVPSMFGRELAEQVRADSKDSQRLVPVIVDKCIDAVDFHGLEYEGIYRKTGGSRLCKIITQLFERGEYDAFDLRDSEEFNDICSITSVLKSYFRSLPDPLLTYALHDQFIEASVIKEASVKTATLHALVSELPKEHYYTTRALMLHLHRVCKRSEVNLMHARNLGVVFGPTLMRSRDPNMEFSDMAGKALSVEWLVENAPVIFESSD